MKNLKFKNLMNAKDLAIVKGGKGELSFGIDPVKNVVGIDPVKNVVGINPVKNVPRP